MPICARLGCWVWNPFLVLTRWCLRERTFSDSSSSISVGVVSEARSSARSRLELDESMASSDWLALPTTVALPSCPKPSSSCLWIKAVVAWLPIVFCRKRIECVPLRDCWCLEDVSPRPFRVTLRLTTCSEWCCLLRWIAMKILSSYFTLFSCGLPLCITGQLRNNITITLDAVNNG